MQYHHQYQCMKLIVNQRQPMAVIINGVINGIENGINSSESVSIAASIMKMAMKAGWR
jgi:hypothetical protein